MLFVTVAVVAIVCIVSCFGSGFEAEGFRSTRAAYVKVWLELERKNMDQAQVGVTLRSGKYLLRSIIATVSALNDVHQAEIIHLIYVDHFRTAVPFYGQTT